MKMEILLEMIRRIINEEKSKIMEFGPLYSPQKGTHKPEKVKPIGPKRSIKIYFNSKYKDMYDVMNLLTDFDPYVFGWLHRGTLRDDSETFHTKYPLENLKLFLDDKKVKYEVN